MITSSAQIIATPSVGALAPNTPGTPVNNGPGNFFAATYGVKADALNVQGCTGAIGLSTVTCTGAIFTSADIGKIIWASGTANSTPDLPQTTITSVVNSTSITVAGTLARTMTAGEAVYGTDQTVSLNTAWAAVMAAPNCGTLNLPAGGMIITAGVMNTPVPGRCLFDQAAILPSIVGQGTQTTIFYPAPNFTYFSTSICSAGGGSGCFGPGQANITNLEIYGGYGGNLIAAHVYNGCWVTLGTPGNLNNVVLQSYFNPGNMATVCVQSGNSWIMNTQIFGFSGLGTGINCTALYITSAAATTILNGFIVGSCNQDGANLIMAANGTLNIYSSSGSAPQVNPWLCTAGHTTFFGGMAYAGTTAGGIKATGAGTTLNLVGVWNTVASAAYPQLLIATLGAKITVTSSNFTNTLASGTTYAVTLDSTSIFVDGCGNTLSANTATANIAAGGLFIPCDSSTYKGSQSVPTVTGTGACATITTQVGNMFAGTLKCTGVTGASTIVLTPGLTAANGWRCSASDLTTNANLLNQSGSGVTTCTLSAATITANDVIAFQLTQY